MPSNATIRPAGRYLDEIENSGPEIAMIVCEGALLARKFRLDFHRERRTCGPCVESV